MPTFNDSTYGDRSIYVDKNGNHTTGAGQLLIEKTGFRNDTISRVHPPVETSKLYQYMTSLPVQYRVTKTPAQRKYVFNDGSYSIVYQWGSSPPAPTSPDWALALRLKIQDLSVNLSSAVAEFEQIHTGFVAVASQLKRIRDRMVSSRGRRLNLCDVSSTNLAINFGVKPVISDFANVIESFNDSTDRPSIIRVSALARETGPAQNPRSSEFLVDGVWDMSDRVVCYLQPKNLGKIDFGNPVEWAWERIPFSFIVDNVIPVGEYLTALFALRKVDILNTSVTQKRKFTGMVTYNPTYSTNSNYRAGDSGTTVEERHSRFVPGVAIPLPRLPSVDITQSYRSLGNAISVLHQLRQCRRN